MVDTYACDSEFDFYRGITAIVALQCVEPTHSLNRHIAQNVVAVYTCRLKFLVNAESANFQNFHVESLNR